MNCPCSSQDLAAVFHASWDEVFLPSRDWNLLSTNHQRVATFNDEHIFVKIVSMSRRDGGLTARPECHLAAVGSVEDIAFHARRRLPRPPLATRFVTAGGNAVLCVFHKLGKVLHCKSPFACLFRSRLGDPRCV